MSGRYSGTPIRRVRRPIDRAVLGQGIDLASFRAFVSICEQASGAPAGGHRGGGQVGAGTSRLGLERLERAQRAPELRERGAAVAHHRVHGSGAVAIADQGETEAAVRVAPLGEHLGLDPVGAREPPGGGHDPLREHRLEQPTGASSASSAASSASNAAASSSASTTILCAHRPCLRVFLALRALPAAVFGPRDLAPLRRLARARALMVVTTGLSLSSGVQKTLKCLKASREDFTFAGVPGARQPGRRSADARV